MLWDAVFDAGHVPLFGLLSLAMLHMIRARFAGLPPRGAWWAAFAVTAGIGAVTELLQTFQPNREPSLEDLVARRRGLAARSCSCAASVPRAWRAARRG